MGSGNESENLTVMLNKSKYLRILDIHGAKTTKNQTPLVHFARLLQVD